ELGLQRKDIKDMRIAGLATDTTDNHSHLLLFGIVSLNTQQLTQKIGERAKQKRPNDIDDFEGCFFVIDATHDAIESVLTEGSSLLPPGNAASLISAGYILTLESEGLKKAVLWKKRVI